MNYILSEANGQLKFDFSETFLMIPSCLPGFTNSNTETVTTKSGKSAFCFKGTLDLPESERVCTCGCRMQKNDSTSITLRHLPFGGSYTVLNFDKVQLFCPKCKATKMQYVSFAAPGHRMTAELYNYARDLLARGTYTLKEVAELTGLGKNTVKDIDLQRLKEKYTIDGEKLAKPEKQAVFLGIDEFKLHNGHKYATHITDLHTGHILWIQAGKKKQVVYDFIDFVGLDWMKEVKAVACDMNSDFQEAFLEKCPHLKIVFDHFHIIKNFNEKVVAPVRIAEQKRLMEAGDTEAAESLKHTKYILSSKRTTLQRKDQEAREGRIISKGSTLFKEEQRVRKEGYEAKYDALLEENKLLFTIDLIKEKLDNAYKLTDPVKMGTAIADIVWDCMHTGNEHFEWFGRLLMNHHDGIITYAVYHISTGKMEGINNKIKTIRRHGYGYPDDEYFFLKLIDMSRVDYVRNPKSHKFCD